MANRFSAAVVAQCAFIAAMRAAADVAVCPGESGRYGDRKCNHDPTHRVCATLLNGQGQPLTWGPKGDFWQITGQKAFQWDAQIRANGGDSWCICMWATAHLITAAGCENVHLNCAATDVAYVMQSYNDGGVDLQPARACLQQKCPGVVPMQKDAVDEIPTTSAGGTASFPTLPHAVAIAGLVAAVLAAAAFALRQMASRAKPRGRGSEEGLLE